MPKLPTLPDEDQSPRTKRKPEQNDNTPQIKFRLLRRTERRVNQETVNSQVSEILEGALQGDRKNWEVNNSSFYNPKQTDGMWTFQYLIVLKRKPSRKKEPTDLILSGEKVAIIKALDQRCKSSKYSKSPWEIDSITCNWNDDPTVGSVKEEGEESDYLVDFNQAKTFSEIKIPSVLLEGSNEAIEKFGPFNGIFDRSEHIRLIMNSIQTMIETHGGRRNHCLLHGLPGCAKSRLVMGIQQVLGPGSFIKINGNAATKAGVETMFLQRLRVTGIPPVFIIEEIEKTNESILDVWLSILDERREVRKLNNRVADRVDANVLVIATANDINAFHRMMGGSVENPGAISSRFPNQFYVPRPSESVMRRILHRDIELYGGNPAWVEPCIQLMKDLKTDDPRKVISFLDGRDRLLTREYQRDIMRVSELEKRTQPVYEEDQEKCTI